MVAMRAAASLAGAGIAAYLVLACTVLNRIDGRCNAAPEGHTIEGILAAHTWIEGDQPIAVMPAGPTAIAFLSGSVAPPNSTDAHLSLTTFGSDELDTGGSCSTQEPEQGVDPRASDLGPGVAMTPAIAAATDNGSPAGALAYRWKAAVTDAGTSSDQIRLTLLKSDGCPAPQDTATFRSLEEPVPLRALMFPHVAYVSNGIFAVTWLSHARDERLFDDRMRAQLVKATFPYGAPNTLSQLGDPIDLALGDRWIQAPRLLAIDLVGARRLVVLWYAIHAVDGNVRMALLDDQLSIVGGPVTLDTDTGSDVIIARAIDAAYEPSSHTLSVVWSKMQAQVSTIVGRRVDLRPEIVPGEFFAVTTPDDGPAFAPTIAALPRGDVLLTWGTSAGISASVLRPNGNRRFTSHACGTAPFPLTFPGDTFASGPANATTSNNALTVCTVAVGRGDSTKFLVGRSVLPIGELFPHGI